MKYYFDIIDLVKFAQRNGSVRGIQRVQICLLRHLSSTTEKDKIFCVYAINRLSGIKVCWSKNIFMNETHGASRILVRLGVGDPYEAFSKRELDDDLAKCKKRFFNHVLRKFKRLILGGPQWVGTVNKKSRFRWRVSEASEKKFYKQN